MRAVYPPDPLPRRSFLGVDVRRTAPHLPNDAVAGARGLEVVRVIAGGTAERAGVRVGDRLVALDGAATEHADELVARSRALRSGDAIALEIARGAEVLRLAGLVVPLPRESIAGAVVEHAHVVADGVRLRTISTRPLQAGAAAQPITVVMLPGLGGASCETSPDDDGPGARLLEALTAGGLATLRVERSGLGDSEGPPHAETDFFAELAGYRAAIESLVARARAGDGGPILVFGQSVGGMFAPLLADAGSGVAGVVVFGTSSQRWLECIVQSTCRQRALRGLSGADLDTYVSAWAELHERVLDGLTPEEAFVQAPHLRALEGTAARGSTLFGRHARFFQQLDRVDLEALWSTVAAPVLVLHGTNDWVCAPAEGERIASRAPRARYVALPGVAHDMRTHASLEASLERPDAGVWDGQISAAILSDLQRLVAR